jgi:hypothetical protein
MARAGSMWTHNVIREALEQAGYRVLPEQVPWNNEDKLRIFLDAALPDQDPANVYVLKTHKLLTPDMPRTYFISTVRDLRDALMSWKRFMNADFDAALQAAEGMAKTCDHYLSFPENKHTRIRYVDIIQAPAATLTDLCRQLGLTLSAAQIDGIVAKHSKANVARRIAAKEQDYKGQLRKGFKTDDIETIAGYNDSIRLYDKATGFQSGHVSDYQDGDWRNILSAEQIDKMHERLGPWLERNGFA